jgi:hypothetical protein
MDAINTQVPVQARKLSASEIIKKVVMKAGRTYFEPVKALSLGAGLTTTVTFTNQDNIPFLIQKIIGYARVTSSLVQSFAYTVKFQDSGRSQLMMSQPMHGSALGSREYPMILEVPYLVRGSGQFQVEITNLSAAPMDIFLTFQGYKIDERADVNGKSSIDVIKSVLMQAGSLFFQSVSVAGLVAGAMATVPFTNQDNVPFLISKVVGYGENASGLAQTYNFTLQFKDSGMIQLWMNTPIYGLSIGSGNLPTILEAPYALNGTSTFETTFANVDASITENLYVTFIGFRLNGIQI